jgi:hypothetical protein
MQCPSLQLAITFRCCFLVDQYISGYAIFPLSWSLGDSLLVSAANNRDEISSKRLDGSFSSFIGFVGQQ